MSYVDAAALADRLLREHGLARRGWTFRFNNAKRSLGLCRYADRRIELSRHFVLGASRQAVRETLLHEIAHALAGSTAGHGPRWKAICLQIGARPERLASEADAAHLPQGRWRADCPKCGHSYRRFRSPTRNATYWCRTCGPRNGRLRFVDQHAAVST